MTEAMTRQMELENMLFSFHLPSFKKQYQDFARKAERERLDHVAYLFELCRIETQDRYNRKTEKLLKEAKLPKGKRMDDFEYQNVPSLSKLKVNELATGACLDACENVLIFGNPGTGKTHIAVALGREWCLRGRRVLFTTAAAIVQDLLAAKRDLKLNKALKKLDKFDAIIIDDISYIPQDRDETDVLFLLLAERYERRSIVATSNLKFSEWSNIFKDPMTTMAAIDRLVHHSTILELNGPSWRANEATERKRKRELGGTATVKQRNDDS